MKNYKNVVILGSGPSGMSVAWGLINEGTMKITLLESSNDVGGLSKTLSYGGISFDIGPHRLSPQLPEIVIKVKELLGDDLLVKRNYHGMYFKELMFDYPLRIKNFLKIKAIFLGLIFGLSFVYARIKFMTKKLLKFQKKNNFKEELITYFGKSFCDIVLFPIVKKAYGRFDLHPEFFETRFTKPSFIKLLMGMFIKSYKVNDEIFYYPKKGYGQIFEVLKKQLVEKGINIELGARINRIETESLNGPFKIVYIKDSVEKEIDADLVVSSIPNKYLINYLSDTGLVGNFIEKMEGFTSRVLRMGVFLVKDFDCRARVIHFPEDEYIFNRISLMNHFADLDYPDNHSVLMIDVICDIDDSYDRMQKEDFNNCLLESVLKLGWFNKDDISKFFSIKVPYAYPLVTVDRFKLQEEFNSFLDSTNILLCGREASTDYNNAHNAMAKGLEVSRFIKGEIDLRKYKKESIHLGRLPILE